jgi:hypothetical protein
MKRARLNPMSKRRERENTERRVMLEREFGPRDTWRCWVRHRPILALMMGGCYGDVNGHEIVKRSQGGSIVDPKNILLLCARHNSWVEDYPEDAHKLGLMKHNWENE